jgi:AGZA family xanthine/uracil permease-like MFS transporter
VTILGIVLTLALRARGFRGDLFVGIIGTTVVATIINHATGHAAFGTSTATFPGWGHIASWGNWSTFGNFDFHAFSKLGVVSAIVWVFALFLSDFFDTMGTLVGVGKPAGYLNEQGEMPDIRKPLLVDSLAAIAGGASSTSSATTQVAVTTPSNASVVPSPCLTLVRMIGFRKMMYDMTMNVVMPAIVSRASVVPCSANRNRRSRSDSRNVAAIVLIETVLLWKELPGPGTGN